MSAPGSFASVLGPTITRYLALKQALGRGYAVERVVFQRLDAFLAAAASDLTPDTFAGWCHSFAHLASGVRRNWMRIVRNLGLYRRRTDPTCFLPDPSQFPPPHQPVQPHIFTDAEILRLLRAADALGPTPAAPLRPQAFRLALVLLYTTGLRRGELLRLTLGDYDCREGTLLVRASKFHKSRLLPLSTEGVREIEGYLAAHRARQLPLSAERPLLWNRFRGGQGYTEGGFGQGIRALLRATGIRTAAGRLPRVHDFRHAFAVHALLRWYRSGVDVQAKLPLLAAYMGHVSIVSTQYYLRFLDALAGVASERFADRCGALVTALPASRGGEP
jgi:integrase